MRNTEHSYIICVHQPKVTTMSVIPKPPGMPVVKIPTPPGLEASPAPAIPKPPSKDLTENNEEYASGGKAWGAVDPDQIDMNTVLVTIGHLSRVLGDNPATVNKKLKDVMPAKIIGSYALFLLKDVVVVRDYRINPSRAAPHPKYGAPKDFTGDQPPPGATPAELKTFYQAKQAEQGYIKTRTENARSAGELLDRGDVERTIIDAFKVVAHYLDSIGDILERDGVITHAEVAGVDRSVDSIREQMAAALREITNNKVDDL